MNKELKKHRFDITDYRIRMWGSTCFIERHDLTCILERTKDDERFCFGLQTNLHHDGKEEKVLKICLEIEEKMRELHNYLEEN